MSTRTGTSLVALTVLVALAPGAQAAKSKLYSVSLKGDVHDEITTDRQDAVDPPAGCVGSMSERRHFEASADLAPKPKPAPIASYSRLKFRALIKSPHAVSTSDTSGGFSPDPDFPPDDPSACAVQPGHKSYPCHFLSEATRRSGGEFALLPNAGKYEIYYNRSAGMLSCDEEDYFSESPLDSSPTALTKLRVRAVKGLGRGRSVSASGTITTPPRDPSATGGETLDYTLKVRRVR
jgi:hypothetical protein